MAGFASSNMLQCGPYLLDLIPDSLFQINGQTVTSQKIKVLGDEGNGMRIDMGLMPARDGNNYGFDYIHHPGSDKRFLNVQLLQNGMDAPKVIGSFPCRKVSLK
ncbi:MULTISPECIES: hypothetical protein [unclassified Tatumella]|uniref:hypothetical protein n=1 Tax=unclassified Tatumella TaxID=2649542 RepID=UPI001BB0CED2|nr:MULTISPECIES: hypothetical protein [unclassified Tatumella]MBS0877998.1 hypothetical protein [Tatumella sp. JGM82]MBS0891279.1 hypothetical protein [Tatumella sp. JGM94]MBS0902658.1 hypothetical protein [Tatumella sp. JGM100]